VSAETARYLELLEERLALLGSLATALTAARLDIVSLDIDGLEARISEQDRLCTEIRALDLQLDRVQQQCTAHLGPASLQAAGAPPDPAFVRCRETLDRLTRVQATVKQLNNEHQALLRRSRRTVNALLNSYHSFAITYSNPVEVPVIVGESL
jgi:FlgN protein